ncbi:efflux RND transporter periplasmic adaptor subunit [[Pasteurella] aerogenes]|nr:efflux RND transporter periplasmic adaptor subunit [[Pasteurella] aerogenes]
MSNSAQLTKPKRSHTLLMKLVLGFIVLAFAIVIGLNVFKGIMIGKTLAAMGEPVNPVTVIKLEPRNWTPIIATTGTVRPKQGAMLSAQSAGTIAKVNIQSGQAVKKGDLLVELDSSVERANLNSSLAQLPSLRQIYQRYSALYKSKSISQQELDNAKANYDALVANIESLKAVIERRQIVAPFDGVAGIVKVNVGEYVTVSSEIVRVEDRSSMQVDFSVSQNDLKNIHLGQKVSATVDAIDGQTFNAKITAIEPAINSATGLMDIQATFEPEDANKLLSGMFTRLNVSLPTEQNQIVVPQVAVSYNMYGEMAYVLTALSEEDKAKLAGKDNLDKIYRAKQVSVFTQDRRGIEAHLKPEGVKLGDIIVTSGQQSISNGSLVMISDKEGVGTREPETKTNL